MLKDSSDSHKEEGFEGAEDTVEINMDELGMALRSGMAPPLVLLRTLLSA